MSSPADARVTVPRSARDVLDGVLLWNRRIHYYLGLYLLFFTWFFILSGLLLNHPRWRFAEFWPNRVQATEEYEIGELTPGIDEERASELMRRLRIAGEVQWPMQKPDRSVVAFQVSRPGLILDVKADLTRGRVLVHRQQLNTWGVIHLLHSFTGVRADDTRNTRDWLLTSVWALSMDLVALGLVVMVFSSYIMWWRLKARRIGGVVALIAGLAGCAAFMGMLG